MMEGDFFSQLRHLVGVEREVAELQRNILHTGSQRWQQPTRDTACPLITTLGTDLKNLKMEGRRGLASLCDDGGFMDIVPLCWVLLQHQANIITDVESHVAQYGYTPLQPRCDEDKSTHKIEQHLTPAIHGQDKDIQQADVTMVSATPLAKPVYDKDRTPTLEDFGLSEGYMAAIVKQRNAFKEPPQRAVDEHLTHCVPPASAAKWSSSESIPEKFHNPAGITITPGLFHGRQIPTITPTRHTEASSRYVTPEAATPKQSLFSCLEVADSNSTYRYQGRVGAEFSSPTLATGHMEMPDRPVALPPVCVRQEEEEEEDSPVPPVLCTPGVKQLFRPALDSGEINSDMSPRMPVFGSSFMNKLMQRTAMVSLNQDTSSSDNSPEPPQLRTPHLKDMFQSKLTTKPATMKHDKPHTVVLTPVSPQLTLHTVELYPQSSVTQFFPDEDEYLPATPEMTFNLRTAAKHVHHTAPRDPEAAPGLKQQSGGLPATAAPVRGRVLSSTETVNKQEPKLACKLQGLSTKSPTATPVGRGDSIIGLAKTLPSGLPRVRAITWEEYLAQPKWAQRQLSFDMAAKGIDKINSLLVQKVKGCQTETLSDRDIGSMALALMLSNTGRLVVHSTHELGIRYTIPHHI